VSRENVPWYDGAPVAAVATDLDFGAAAFLVVAAFGAILLSLFWNSIK
jgi:hypothetical protein